jgi:hypothetical protein
VRAVKQVLIMSHADADGHVIAEQVRRNLVMVPTFEVSTVVDTERTRDHRIWMNLERISEIETSEIVFFVDLMFAPPSFVAEAEALVGFVLQRRTKEFFLLDHHPLPLKRLSHAYNLHSVYRPDVVDCTFGHASWLMVIAALLEKQPTRIIANAEQKLLAKGVKRAAAIGGPLAGDKLLTLMRFERWGELLELGRDDAIFHRLPRGRRPTNDPLSDLMHQLDRLATDLLQFPPGAGKPHLKRSAAISYDLDLVPSGVSPAPIITPSDPRDLEAIMTLLELAAISLTEDPDSSFTMQQLLERARELGGSEVRVDENDIKIVLGKAGFLKKEGGRFRLK